MLIIKIIKLHEQFFKEYIILYSHMQTYYEFVYNILFSNSKIL